MPYRSCREFPEYPRLWDFPNRSIRARLNNLRKNGFGPKPSDWAGMQAERGKVLDRVQRHAEEYEYLTHSCAKGSALPPGVGARQTAEVMPAADPAETATVAARPQ